MITSRQGNAGFSIVELIVASCIFVVGVAVAFGGYIHMLRGLTHDDVQNELDVDVQTSMERLKYDMRLTSLDKMFFYPEGPGPYTAVSFPLARDDDGDGAVDMDEDDFIIWDRTIIYHVWEGEPHQFRRTVFDPRDNALTDAQRQEQINVVAAQGGAASAHNGSNATTRTVFENLFQWSIVPKGAVYDAYAPATTRDENVLLGSCLLGTGVHDLEFAVLGKNGASTGYKIGIDSLRASPSANRREGENCLPVQAQAGALADHEYMPGGSWNGNYQLVFPAIAVGNYVTLRVHNDLWRETNFNTLGDSHDETAVSFDTSLYPSDFVVALAGSETNWSAAMQTADPVGAAAPAGLLRGAAVRVLLRGEEMAGGNWISSDGARCRVAFRAAPGQDLDIVCAYIGEASSSMTNTMDVAPATQTQLLFGGAAAATVPGATTAWSDIVDFGVEREKSYLVSYVVSDGPANGTPWQWADQINGAMGSAFLIPGSAASPSNALQETWSARGDVCGTNALLGVEYLWGSYPGTGVYISAVCDTHCDAPAYSEINWDALVPSGTDIRLRVRTGNASDLSDAPAWTNIPPIPAFGLIEPGSGRYAQFHAELMSDPTHLVTPRLKEFMIKWHGQQRMVDISGTFTKGPEYGVFRVTVDGEEIVTGVLVEMEIYKDARGHIGTRRIRSQAVAEVYPRNSGL